MNLADVMNEVATQLGTIDALEVVAYPDGQVNPPCAVVAMPSQYTFDDTYGRGADRMTLPVVLLVSGNDPETARDSLGAYCDGSGDSSLKAVLEAADAGYTAFDSVRVTGIVFDIYTYGGTEFPAAIFDLDIYGSGSA
jgi:hypothetical protein